MVVRPARAPIHTTERTAVPGRAPLVVCRQIADQLVGTARHDVTQVGTGIAL